jgi:hypothetical protein
MPTAQCQSRSCSRCVRRGGVAREQWVETRVRTRLYRFGCSKQDDACAGFELGPPGRQKGNQRRLAGAMAQAADDTAGGSGGMRGCAGRRRWSSGLCGWVVVDRKAQPPTSGALGGKVVASLARKLGDGRPGQSNDADGGPTAKP